MGDQGMAGNELPGGWGHCVCDDVELLTPFQNLDELSEKLGYLKTPELARIPHRRA